MKKTMLLLVGVLILTQVSLIAQVNQGQEVSQNRIAEYIHWYPAIKQIEMRDEWLAKNDPGEWSFTGMVTADDHTVITPQADVNYGYSWFNISNEPIVVTMPQYDKYYSLSIFDMNHFIEVFISPEKPVVIRLPHQKSPIANAMEVVLQTNQGLAFTRQVIVGNETEVMEASKNITIKGGGGNRPFIVPDFTEDEASTGMNMITDYSMKLKGARKLFGSPYEGVGDMDRCAGVFLGQLGTQAYIVDYAQYVIDNYGDKLTGEDSYEITVPEKSLMKNNKGYWSLTIYSMEDRYLIPNKENKYVISFYKAKKNKDGSLTIRINPNGVGENALPTKGKPFYAVFRVYEPIDGIVFPEIRKMN